MCVLNQNAKKIFPQMITDLFIFRGEFGFSENKFGPFEKNKSKFCKICENILRAETAPLVALSIQNI
ncbi:MAG: hypothetical protein CM15mP12_6860 [Gammaproteobacteria bacterium]|nr:MAG: hypothetical protein CM15mP12_6860 [Gammaproteobacteria bacterium]